MIGLLDFIREVYGNNTMQEVKLAFQMAISGKLELPGDYGHYQQFSSSYFGQTMAAYRVWASQVHDYHSRSAKNQPAIEQAPIEMTDDEFINAAYQTFKALRTYMVIPESIFDMLKSQKKITLDREDKDRIKALVMDRIKTGVHTDEKFALEYDGMSPGQREAFIQSYCKKCAVAKYFSSIIEREGKCQ
jgi:hypothetical protein